MKLGLGLFRARVPLPVDAAIQARAVGAQAGRCFHCVLPLPVALVDCLVFDEIRRPLCCAGCLGAAELLIGHGFAAAYRDRAQQHG